MTADPHLHHTVDRHGETIGRAVVSPRCHIYLRVSSPDQDLDKGPDGRRIRVKRSRDDRERDVKRSLDTQEEQARDHARRMGYAVVDVYRETFTGTEFWTRPELARLRERLVAREVDVMLCYSVQRFLREQTQLGVIYNLCKASGARLEFVVDKFEDTAVGKFLLQALAFAAEFELESNKEKFSRGKRARVEAGRPLHGKEPPYGCAWADEGRWKYRWSEPQATHVQELFEGCDQGMSRRALGRWMEDRGVPAPFGGTTWYPTTVALILSNPIYCGHPEAFRYKSIVGKTGRKSGRLRRLDADGVLEAPGVWGTDTPQPLEYAVIEVDEEGHPCYDQPAAPLVDQTRFDRVQARLADPSPGGRPPDAAAGWLLLGGYARCSSCQGALTSYRQAHRGEQGYRCDANKQRRGSCSRPVAISKGRLETKVWADCVTYLRQPHAVADALRARRDVAAQDTPAATAAALAAVEATLVDVRAEQDALVRDQRHVRTESARAALHRRLDELGEQDTRLVAEAAQLRAVQGELATREQEFLDLAEAAQRASANLDDPAVFADPARRRDVVVMLAPRVEVGPARGRGPAAERDVLVDFVPETVRYAAVRAVLSGTGGTEVAQPLDTSLSPSLRHPAPGLAPLTLRFLTDGALTIISRALAASPG